MIRFAQILMWVALAAITTISYSQERKSLAVIGTGDMGNSLGPKLAEIGYEVIYGSRDPTRESVAVWMARSSLMFPTPFLGYYILNIGSIAIACRG
jgi:lactate dehydrogenase-like 2-hydroxyacid dehydrogenase